MKTAFDPVNPKPIKTSSLLRPRFRNQKFRAVGVLKESEVRKKVGGKKQLRFLYSTSHYLILLLIVLFFLIWFRPWEMLGEFFRII